MFVGTKNLLIDAFGMKSDKQFAFLLECNIRQRVDLNELIPDSTQSEINTRVKDCFNAFFSTNGNQKFIINIKTSLKKVSNHQARD